MKKFFNIQNSENKFLGGSSLHRKIRDARKVNRGRDSFYRRNSFNYTLI